MPMNEKQTVAISSMVASALMTLGKFGVGLATGSLGLLSEGLHSLLDFGATIMTFMAVRVSDLPADDEHPYGHGKIESIAALAETGLLFVTSFWIIYEAVHRLLAGKVEVEATWGSVAVIVVSIVIDISRARALKRVAKKTKSQALEADALHFSSDVLSSAVVLCGLGLVAIGWPTGDAIAAIGVSIFVCHAGWVLGKRTIDTLIDAAPQGALDRVRSIVETVDGVAAIHRVRLRPAGSVLFVEADVAIGRGLSQERAAMIKRTIEKAVHAEMSEAEITITTQPLALNSETVHQRVMIIAANHGAAVHHVTVHRLQGRLSVGYDLEVDGKLSIRAAHDMASHLEAEIKTEFGGDIEVETHIEPLQAVDVEGVEIDTEELESLRKIIAAHVDQAKYFTHMHNLRARRTPEGLIVIFHCRVAPDTQIGRVHELVDKLEHEIRQSQPTIWRLICHAEPELKVAGPDDARLETAS